MEYQHLGDTKLLKMERPATPDLIRELVRDDSRRGEFMIMMDDEDVEGIFLTVGKVVRRYLSKATQMLQNAQNKCASC